MRFNREQWAWYTRVQKPPPVKATSRYINSGSMAVSKTFTQLWSLVKETSFEINVTNWRRLTWTPSTNPSVSSAKKRTSFQSDLENKSSSRHPRPSSPHELHHLISTGSAVSSYPKQHLLNPTKLRFTPRSEDFFVVFIQLIDNTLRRLRIVSLA